MGNLTKISLRYLLIKKRHTVVTIILGAVSVALIALVFTALSTVFMCYGNYTADTQGRYHYSLAGLTKEQANALSKNAIFTETEISNKQSFFDDPHCINENDDGIFYLLYHGETHINDYFVSYNPEKSMLPNTNLYNVLNGRLPQNSGEITLSNYTYSIIGEPELGSKISFTLKLCKFNDNSNEDDMLNKPVSEISSELSNRTFTYTVVGVQSNTNVICSDESDMLTVIDGNYTLRGRFKKDIYDINAEVDKALTSAGITSGDKAEISQMLLNCEFTGVEAKANFAKLGAIGYIIVLVLLACTRMLIDCAFEISSKEKTQHFGLLKSCGASNKQLCGILFSESMLISVIAVPLGIILGNLIAFGLFEFVKDYLIINSTKELVAVSSSMVFYISPLLMGITAVTGAGWIFFSDYGSGLRMIKKMPVDTMFPERNRKNTSPKIRRSILKKLFGLSGQLTSINIRQNLKRYIITIVSLSLSMILFIGFSFGFSILDSEAIRDVDIYGDDYNAQIYVHNTKDYHKITNELNKTGLFTDVQAINHIIFTYGKGENTKIMNIIAFNKETYSHITSPNLFPTYDEMVQNNTLLFCLPSSYDSDDEDIKALEDSDYNTIVNIENIRNDEEINIDLKLLGAVEAPDMASSSNDYYWMLLCTEEQYDKYYSKYNWLNDCCIHLNYAEGKESEALSYLIDIPGYSVIDNVAPAVENLKAVKIAKLTGYIVIGLIALIAVINLINIIITGLLNRKREIGLLKAAGITDSQLTRMLFIESGLYSVVSTLISIIVILGAAAVIVGAGHQLTAENVFHKGIFTLFYAPLIKLTVQAFSAVLVLSMLTSLYVVKEIKSLSVVETIACKE